MNQETALNIMMAGANVFLTGPAGSGKTYILNKFIKQARREGRYVSVTASTGLAATHLGGTTIHSWSGIGVYDILPDNFLGKLTKARKEIIRQTDVLVIDEISMLHDYRLDMVDSVCRRVRKRKSQPFGGMQIVMSGDFFQLPPVNRVGSRAGGFVVNSHVWTELDPIICYLEEQYRQDDEVLLDILNAVRQGSVSKEHLNTLATRSQAQPDDTEQLTEIYTMNIDVDRLNDAKLKQIDSSERQYVRREKGSRQAIKALGKSTLAPEVLRLRRGALVMSIRNNHEQGYVNGSIGTVVAFNPNNNLPIVKFRGGPEVLVDYDRWRMMDGEVEVARVSQLPLRLAWAITVHKSQGMTLDAARIDLSRAFVEGMGYVALSRVKNVNNLYLTGINQMALRVSEEARNIDAYLREKSKSDAKKEIKCDNHSQLKMLG